MKFSDSIGLWGIFTMRVFDMRKGELELLRTIHKKNQIVNEGRQSLLELMAPPIPGVAPPPYPEYQYERQLWSLSAGTNPTPPTINNDVNTMTEAWQHPFTNPERVVVAVAPNDFYVHVNVTMPALGAVTAGTNLVEAGIFTRGDNDVPGSAAGRRLYARQTHPVVQKTDTMVIEYDWRLGISIQAS